MKDYTYNIADFIFRLSAPDSCDVDAMLPSFKAFKSEYRGSDNLLLTLILTDCLQEPKGARLTEETVDDLGYIRLSTSESGFWVEISHKAGSSAHYLTFNDELTDNRACIDYRDPHAGLILSSMLRIVFGQAILLHHAATIHASAVIQGDKSYLFLGKSGTGKSTHSSLWLDHVAGSRLLNDDCPVIRLVGNRLIAYGSPWSGKTPCYQNTSAEVGGIVRLNQADDNIMTIVKGITAFTTLLPSIAAIKCSGALYERMLDFVTEAIAATRIARLDCRPDREAAILCSSNLIIS